MNIELADINTLIRDNTLPEVKNPVYIDGSANRPTEDGLFSYEMFGRPGGQRRKFQYGFIDLGKHFLHPLAYVQLQKLFSKLPDLILGKAKFVITKDGHLLQDDEAGETGIEFLYKNFESLKFDSRGVKSREKRAELFKLYKKDVIFCSKWLTIPPFYYDINFKSGSGAKSIDELASLYIKLISYGRMLKNDGAFFTAYATEFNIQSTLVEIMKLLNSKVAKKQGVIHKDILGKTIDYTVRSVITCPKVRDANSYRDVIVPYGYAGVPLYQLAVLYMPFVVGEMEKALQSLNAYRLYLRNSKALTILDSTVDQISSVIFEKIIKFFAKSPENRTQRFIVETAEGANLMDELFKAKLGRFYTVADFVYTAVHEAIRGKYLKLTRFPLEDYRNAHICKPVIITTEVTIPEVEIITGLKYKNYPDLTAPHIRWIDSILPNQSILSGLGGDFDGDTVSLTGIFTQEGNADAARSILKPSSLVEPGGGLSRDIIKEGVLSLYELTK